jgi:hypothetical protein
MTEAIDNLYYELTDDTFFVDYANIIVAPKGGKHWKLPPDATYIVRLLLAKVRVGMVAKILAELKYNNNYEAALAVVAGLVQELERKALIQQGTPPEILMSDGDKAVEGTRQQTLTTAILPKVPGRY